MSITIHKPLSPCQKCHFIKAQTNNKIEQSVQQEQQNKISSQFDYKSEENNSIDNFLYALKAPETKRQYPRRLKVFLDFLQINSPYSDFDQDLRYKASTFTTLAKQSPQLVLDKLIKFILFQKERAAKGEISECTISNYYKPTKLFCEMNDIVLNWKRITKGIPSNKHQQMIELQLLKK